MANLKYSRQREAIKDYLSSVTTHPTADTVYMHIKEDFPNISLGTVYRNLNLLADIGEAIKITTPDGGDRFDARTNPHYHFYCKINQLASESFDGQIESHTMLFYGICGDCLRKS